ESVGFDKEMQGRKLDFPKTDSPVEEQNERKLSYYRVGDDTTKTEKEIPKELVSDNEQEYIQAAVFIPAFFEGNKDYIFLGLKKPVEDISDFVKRLDTL
ncbi:MAG: hypothetical protein ACLFQW_07020, partial [Spirochaetaceae bacterium]